MVEKLNLFLDLLQSYKVSLGSSRSGPVSFQGCGREGEEKPGLGGGEGGPGAGCPGAPLGSCCGVLRASGFPELRA